MFLSFSCDLEPFMNPVGFTRVEIVSMAKNVSRLNYVNYVSYTEKKNGCYSVFKHPNRKKKNQFL